VIFLEAGDGKGQREEIMSTFIYPKCTRNSLSSRKKKKKREEGPFT
jgi:hypothetical protein